MTLTTEQRNIIQNVADSITETEHTELILATITNAAAQACMSYETAGNEEAEEASYGLLEHIQGGWDGNENLALQAALYTDVLAPFNPEDDGMFWVALIWEIAKTISFAEEGDEYLMGYCRAAARAVNRILSF